MKEKTIEKNLTPAEMFDLDDLSDLSEKVLNEIKRPKSIDIYLKLLEAKSPLTMNEIIIGLYRKFGVEKTRNSVRAELRQFIRDKKPLIERVKSEREELYQKCQG